MYLTKSDRRGAIRLPTSLADNGLQYLQGQIVSDFQVIGEPRCTHPTKRTKTKRENIPETIAKIKFVVGW